MNTIRLDTLDVNARDLATRSMNWMDARWDADAGLLVATMGDGHSDTRSIAAPHIVRESSQYALGLLMRGQTGDPARACQALSSVLAWQFDAPEQPYHGTWRRAPEEPAPPEHAVVWRDYDPNWREFIGTTLALILLEYASALPRDLIAHIDNALRNAIAGTLARDLPANYTNIALMQAWLLHFGAERFDEPAWETLAEQRAEQIYQLFAAHDAFWEYNSPTYYGVDLYALALWRSYATSALLRERGAAMEEALWRDIAQFYHAGMRNVAGPYDRSYGMDMRRYVACLGMWIFLAVGRERAPLPDTDAPFEHAWDFCSAPLYALLGVRMPDDALPHFQSFQGERQVTHVISDQPHRVATAWIGRAVMLGGEDISGRPHPSNQFHPATIHWRYGDNAVGWIRLLPTAAADARAERNSLHIACTEQEPAEKQIVFQIAAPVAASAIHADRWRLPSLTVRVETNAPPPTIVQNDNGLELRYAVQHHSTETPIRFVLRAEQAV